MNSNCTYESSRPGYWSNGAPYPPEYDCYFPDDDEDAFEAVGEYGCCDNGCPGFKEPIEPEYEREVG